MAFILQTVSNVGTSHPIVARLCLQTPELMKWSGLTEGKQAAINEIYYGLHERLLRCEKTANSIVSSLEKDALRIKTSGTNEIPYVQDLDGFVTQFLIEAKSFVRDLVGVFNVAYGCDFSEASALANLKNDQDSKLVGYLLKHVSDNIALIESIRGNQDWLKELIKKRNAQEHPGGHSSTLIVKNVRVEGPRVLRPSWQRGDGPISEIVPNMREYVADLFALAEYVCLNIVSHTIKLPQEAITTEVPQHERDKACPIRYKPNLDMIARAAFHIIEQKKLAE